MTPRPPRGAVLRQAERMPRPARASTHRAGGGLFGLLVLLAGRSLPSAPSWWWSRGSAPTTTWPPAARSGSRRSSCPANVVASSTERARARHLAPADDDLRRPPPGERPRLGEAGALGTGPEHVGGHPAEPAHRGQRVRLPGPHRRRRHCGQGREAQPGRASTASRNRSASTRPGNSPSRCSALSAPTAAGSAASSTSTTRRWRAGPGKSVEQIDPQGHQIPGGIQEYQAPVAGQDLVLSLDEPLQYDAEQALAQAIVAAKASEGIALLMNSKTGEILADAQLTMPTAGSTQPAAVPVSIGAAAGRPHKPSRSKRLRRPRSPTSTSRARSTSSSPSRRPCRPGSSNRPTCSPSPTAIRWPTPPTTTPRTTPRSTGRSPISWPTRRTSVPFRSPSGSGRTTCSSTSTTTASGSVSDVEFPGESAGLLPTYWSGTSIADVAIGQGIAVTAVQMLAAYNTIANGGVYVPPKLVDGTIDAKGRRPRRRLGAVPPGGVDHGGQPDDHHARRGGAGRNRDGRQPGPLHGRGQDGYRPGAFAGWAATKPGTTWPASPDSCRPRTRDHRDGRDRQHPRLRRGRLGSYLRDHRQDALHAFNIPPQPSNPPPPGVPLATTASATGGRDAGTPLPGLATPPSVTSRPRRPGGQPASAPTTAATTPTAPAGGGQPASPPTTARRRRRPPNRRCAVPIQSPGGLRGPCVSWDWLRRRACGSSGSWWNVVGNESATDVRGA